MSNTTTFAVSLLVAGGMASAAGAGSIAITAIVLEGDTVRGVGAIASGFSASEAFAVNDFGEWIVESDTTNANSEADGVLLSGTRGGPFSLLQREGDSVTAPPGASIDFWDAITLNLAGNSAYNNELLGTAGGSDDTAVYFNSTLLIQEGDIATAAAFGANTPYIGWLDVKINHGDQIMMVASVDDPTIGSTVDRAIVLIDDPAGAATQIVIVKEGDEPVIGRLVTELATGPHDSSMNDSGHILFSADLDGDTVTDGIIGLWDGGRVISLQQEGAPSPVTGRNWESLFDVRLDLNNNDAWAMLGDLDGDAANDSLIVRNGADVIAREGFGLPAIGGFTFTSFGSGNVQIDENGNVLWYGDWNDPDTTRDAGLFLNDELLVQEGVTTIDGLTLLSISAVEDNFKMSDDGRWIIFEGVLAGDLSGAFLIEMLPPCAGDLNADGAIDVNDLLLLIGAWGFDDPGADINDDGIVDVNDLLLLVGAWGDC